MGDLSICISFDFDAMSNWIGSFKSKNPVALSRGEFGAAVALERILALLDDHEIRGTFFVPGHTVLAYPGLIGKIGAHGHELGHHGWVHESPADLSRDEEKEVLQRGFEAFDKIAGARPVGYRSPGGAFSANTVDLLLEYGFAYDSSCSASDFYPYYLRGGDSWSATEPYVFGACVDLVEIPYAWVLNDFQVFEFAPPLTTNQYPPSVVREIWLGEFDFALDKCPGGVYTLSLHPQVIGRGHRLKLLDEVLALMRSHDSVRFETMGDVARRWRSEHPMKSWAQENPIYAGRSVT